MKSAPCHGNVSPAVAAHALVKRLGPAVVASWCGVTVHAVYQWKRRATDRQPLPPRHVPQIIACARSAGLDMAYGVLWPALASSK